MTTIAYRDGIMAGDTRITAGDLVCPERERKVFRLRNGCLFGHAGSSQEGELLKRALMRGGDTPKCEDSTAIYIMPDGTILYFEGKAWAKIKAPYVSIGNGSPYAYGALAAGSDAATSVRIACKFDTHSGLPIHTVRLKK